MSYAEGTSVPIERSKADIESMLVRYGAEQFVSGWGASSWMLRMAFNVQ